ncbi:peptidase A4 family-domain-containing protein [Boletus edulis]|uniref:Peptidase A4 family-domain-containing protein n=1 Tax=Boletus edulis BED1 TaxID=1328754 RepID=A0AAD4G933_BOLED|nr:peptidase A4 family-domain-containing protein [Boletus edulis]KAF8430694.1 peptidase A4 family-domain-containing protein [Boletus edulis BED1]
MRFNSGLISCLLLASAVLAGSYQSQQLNLLKRSPQIQDNSELAGARIDSGNSGTFNTITGILVAPILSGDRDSAVAVWMSIDSDGSSFGCANFVTVSLTSTVTADGTQHQASMRWFPNPVVVFPLNIVSGDRIQVTFNTSDWLSGSLTFNNLSRVQSVTKEFKTDSLLCGKYADWMVGRVMGVYGADVPLANFTTLTIQSTSAGLRGGASYGPAEASTLFQTHTDYGVVKPKTDSDSIIFDASGL